MLGWLSAEQMRGLRVFVVRLNQPSPTFFQLNRRMLPRILFKCKGLFTKELRCDICNSLHRTGVEVSKSRVHVSACSWQEDENDMGENVRNNLASEQDKAPGLPVRLLIHNETNVAKALPESSEFIAIFYTFFPLSS